MNIYDDRNAYPAFQADAKMNIIACSITQKKDI